MSLDTKIKQIIDEIQLPARGAQLGLVAMAAAATLGTMPDHADKRVVLPNQPLFRAEETSNQENNPIRREREESAPHFISYSEVQRTPARSGKL
jgi:hypothetical protein